MGIETIALSALAASAVIGAGAAIYSGEQQKQAADAQQAALQNQAAADQDAAVAQAEKIRRAARAQVGEANAALSASGISLGEGTPIRIAQDVYQKSEQDAYQTLLTGSRQAQTTRDQASIVGAQGNAAQIGGYLSAGGTILGAVGTAARSRWAATSGVRTGGGNAAGAIQ